MRTKSVLMIGVLAVVSACAKRAESPEAAKYGVKVPNGLAFSEFKGYENWQLISISQDGPAIAAILGNPDDDQGLQGRYSRQRQAVPGWLQDDEDPLGPDQDGELPRRNRAGQATRRGLHGEGQQAVRG